MGEIDDDKKIKIFPLVVLAILSLIAIGCLIVLLFPPLLNGPRKSDQPYFEPVSGKLKEIIREEMDHLPQGYIMCDPPFEMVVDQNEIIEIRIARSLEKDLAAGLRGRGDPELKTIKVGYVMGVTLEGTERFFAIHLKNRPEKIIAEIGYSEWVFDVLPLKAGTPSLFLTAYILIETPQGLRSYEHPAFIKEIKVTTPNPPVSSGVSSRVIYGILIFSGLLALGLGFAFYFIKKKRQSEVSVQDVQRKGKGAQMEATIVAAMISAGAKVATSIFDKWSGSSRGPEKQKIEEYVEQHYDTLRGLLGNNCVNLLKLLEDGQNRDDVELRRYLYPVASFSSRDEEDRFDEEFKYRLFYLQLVGVVTRPTGEYYITEAGKAFINEARRRRDYFKVLFNS